MTQMLVHLVNIKLILKIQNLIRLLHLELKKLKMQEKNYIKEVKV